MRRLMAVWLIAPLFALPAAAQQAAAPVSDAVRSMLQRMSRNLPAAADDMPVAKFSYKPTPAQLSFGAVVVHEKATRPVPVVPITWREVVFPLVAPAFTVMFPPAVSSGAGTDDGRY